MTIRWFLGATENGYMSLPTRIQQARLALWQDERTLTWIDNKYGWDYSAIDYFNVGLEGGRLLLPTQDLSGEWFYTTRAIRDDDKPKYLHERDHAPLVYHQQTPVGEVYACEGHSDTITAWMLGYKAVGILGTQNWTKAIPYLLQFRDVHVVCDADAGGVAAMIKLWDKLPNADYVFLFPPELNGPIIEWLLYDPLKFGHPGIEQLLKAYAFMKTYSKLNMDLTDYTKLYGRVHTRNRMEGPILGSSVDATSPRRGEGSYRVDTSEWGPGPHESRQSGPPDVLPEGKQVNIRGRTFTVYEGKDG